MSEIEKYERPAEDEPALTPQLIGSSLEIQTRAEIAGSFDASFKRPRSIQKFRDKAVSMISSSPEVAAKCFYSVPRGGKKIEGPSVRLAEILAASWGNLKIASRVIEVAHDHVIAQGVVTDVENNVSHAAEVRQAITDKHGRRYSDDMVTVACNAASAKAFRNAVFRAIPRAIVDDFVEQAREFAKGTAATLPQRLRKALAAFKELGVSEKRIYAALGITGAADVTVEHLATLLGYHVAIRQEGVSVNEVFPSEQGFPQAIPGKSPEEPPPAREPGEDG